MSYEPTNWKKGDKVTSTRLNKIEQGIQGIDNDTSSIKEDLSEYEGIFTADVDESVQNWMDEHPEATTTVQDGSISEAKLTSALSQKIDRLNAKVQLQRVFRIVCQKYEAVGQCAVYTGHSFIFGSPSRSNTHHRIVETDMNGNILTGRDVSWDNETENTILGHMNDMYYYDGKIYVMGAQRTIVVIDYDTLAIETTIALNTADILGDHTWVSLPTLDGIDGTLYTVGTFNDDGAQNIKRVFRIDLSNGGLTEICSFHIPPVYNGVERIGQGLAINNGRGYLAFNYDNAVIEFDVFDGTVYNWMMIEAGDGSVPTGELETCVFVNGQMYIWGPLYYTFSEVSTRTQVIDQLFKTNIGGIISTDRRYGQGEEDQTVIRVNGTSTANNPDGYTEASAFNSVEEACMVYAYRARNTHTGLYQLYVSNPSGLDGQLFYLQGVNFRANLGGAVLGAVELRTATGQLSNLTASNLEIYASNVTVVSATVDTIPAIIGSRVYLTGTIGSITKIERSVVDFRGGTTINANNTSIGTMTDCKITGGHGINLNGSVSVGGSDFVYTLPNLLNAKVRGLPQSEAMILTIMLTSSSWNGSQTSVMIRFTTGDMNNIKSGQTVTRKGSFNALVGGSSPYMVAGIVSATLNLTTLTLALDTYIRIDTNEALTGSVYTYEMTLAPINDQIIG